MESSPLTVENNSEDDSSRKKKSRRAERLGAIVVEPKSEDRGDRTPPEAEGGRESFWHKLTRHEESEKTADGDGSININENVLHESAETDDTSDPEDFTEADRQYAETELARGHLQALDEEFSTVPNDPEAAHSVEAELMALEAFYDRIATEHAPLEEAYAETLQDMGVPPDSPETEAPEETAASSERPAEGHSWDPFGHERATSTNQQSTAEAAEGSPPEEDLGTSGTNGSGNGPPHNPPQGYGYGGGNTPRPPAVFMATNQETRPTPPSRSTTESLEPRYTRSNVIGAALVGGIVGYLVGRRRGRIKTEKKLLPVQKKLEEEVSALESDMFKKETTLRKVAREQQYQQKNIDKLKWRASRQERQLAAAAGVSAEQPAIMTKHALERARVPALEANQLHGKKLPPERIGKVLMSAERPAQASVKKAEQKDRPAARHSETMGRRELMEVSEKITVNNTNLRRIYESHLVGEQGLRRLVEAHMRGGDIRGVLQQEMLEHEIDFERDPVMRDHRPQQDVATRGAGAVLDSLLGQTGLAESSGHEEYEVLKARVDHQAAETQKSARRRRGMDAAFAGTILILIAVIILLLVSR
ncbi:MAG TPA: hypothetical protein VHB72_03240 [Candidatus Saccharimonadales bacterium]|nr:hypothetical protein [Candidatus Saccharimonadales bacterium]